MERTVIAGVRTRASRRFETGYREFGPRAAHEALAEADVRCEEVDFSCVAKSGAKGQRARG